MSRMRPFLRWPMVLVAVLLLAGACSSGGGGAETVDAVGPDVEVEASPAFLATVADRSAEASYRFELDMSMTMDMGFGVIDIDPDVNYVLTHGRLLFALMLSTP